jgi:hypothetical protein
MKMTKKSLDEVIDKAAERVPLEDMPLNSIRDYRLYNEEVRRLNKLAKQRDKSLKEGIYQIKQCPEELHPKQRVTVHNNQQPNNPVPVHLSNDLIHFDKKLQPGVEYDLPECVIHHIASLGNPQWKWRNKADGSKETFYDHKTPRFSVRTVYTGT